MEDTQRISFHQLDRQLHTFPNLSRKQSPSNLFLNIESRILWLLTLVAVQPWHCSGVTGSFSLAVLSFLAAFRAIAEPTGDPFEKLQLCSSLNLSVLAAKKLAVFEW